MSFFTKYDRPKRKCTCLGSRYSKNYEYRMIDGIKLLVPAGESDTDDFIQSFKSEADINIIISRYINGDIDVLNKYDSQFGDFRNVPESYAELFDRVQQCKNTFDVLPVELRAMFNNSYETFWSEYGSESFERKFNDFNDKYNNGVDSGSVIPIPPEPSVNDSEVHDA